MTTSASGAWVVGNHRTRTASQSANKDLNLLGHVSPEELRQQKKLLDRFKREKQQVAEDGRPSARPVVASSVHVRRVLKSLISDPALTRNATIRSNAATVGDADDIGLLYEQPPTPAKDTSNQRKRAQSETQPQLPSRRPTRAQTGAVRPASAAVLLNVNMIGRMSLADNPQAPLVSNPYQFPTVPLPSSPASALPLASLPPGYAFVSSVHFRPEETQHRPLRLLSLDGGGVRGISGLRILKAIMDRISAGARPCDYFDLIAGTSTGGLIAIMLGRLRMSVDECIEEYHKLAKGIFKRNRMVGLGNLVTEECWYDSTNLEEAIKSVVEKYSPRNTKMADHHSKCARVFVVAVKRDNLNNEAARRIRTYSTQAFPADTCEIWQAGRATSAAPAFFAPMEIPDEQGRPTVYIDGGLGHNNPARELLYEARNVFGPDVPIGCFVSIGTGYDKNVALGALRRISSAYAAAFKAISLSSEKAHREMEQFFLRMPGVYYRFNVGVRLIDADGNEDFVQAIKLDDWRRMEELEDLTKVYLREKETNKRIDKCARKLSSGTASHSPNQVQRE